MLDLTSLDLILKKEGTCMNPFMGLKLILLRKSFVAKIARVWAFTWKIISLNCFEKFSNKNINNRYALDNDF